MMNSITISLNHQELQSLVGFIGGVLVKTTPINRMDKITHLLMLHFYKKLMTKCILVMPRQHRFTITPETALAFIEYFRPVNFSHTSYEGNIIQKLINEFDKKTA